MNLITSNKTFGYFFSCIFFILSLILYFYNNEYFHSFFIFSLILLIITFSVPDILTPLNKLWELFGVLLHKIVSNLIIIFIYFVVFLLIGQFMKLFGFDPFRKKAFRKKNSYWENRKANPNTFLDLF